MKPWVRRIHRLSFNQLRALLVLAKSEKGIIEADDSSQELGLQGKSLGGVFSSLARQEIGEEYLIEPWGRVSGSRGYRWKLNQEAISKDELLAILKEILGEGEK